ncbi:uncharacterized protein TEOVI_000619800 [Trypanosoma equiperdum]|uniref:Uncharacterized protein n=2 Tax=Trypanozoon TaxID=39700 RepID=Q382W5_TRYB2|nr:hypothetical protein, conserved [Trypanosoma brucei brucei TREU927]EAN80166.1 hypothetical protein, conserved [Trypanosoma brucei brucei TREU927]SCU65394.1 hypothetical protein, conserved [Trypanosoma equiperdum]
MRRSPCADYFTSLMATAGFVRCRGLSSSGQTNTTQTVHVLHSLYRRLRKEGEERKMLEDALSVNQLETNIRIGLRLLHCHTQLVDLNRQLKELPFWRLVRRMSLAVARRYYAWRIFSIRLRLRSTTAISNALVYTLFLVVCFMLYEIYCVCRIGVTRAEDRYKSLAVPIVQTFEALEEAARRRKDILLKEMEGDIVRQRN